MPDWVQSFLDAVVRWYSKPEAWYSLLYGLGVWWAWRVLDYFKVTVALLNDIRDDLRGIDRSKW